MGGFVVTRHSKLLDWRSFNELSSCCSCVGVQTAFEGRERPRPWVAEAFSISEPCAITASSLSSPVGTVPPSTALRVLRSSAANRAQLYSAFLDAWVPHNILPWERGSSVDVIHFDPEHMSSTPTGITCYVDASTDPDNGLPLSRRARLGIFIVNL